MVEKHSPNFSFQVFLVTKLLLNTQSVVLITWPGIFVYILSWDLILIWLLLDYFKPILAIWDLNEGFRTKNFELWAKYDNA